MLASLIGLGSFVAGLWIGYCKGITAERANWIRQIKQEQDLRHTTQGNAFWQK